MNLNACVILIFLSFCDLSPLRAQTNLNAETSKVKIDSLQKNVNTEKDPVKKEQLTLALIKMLSPETTEHKGLKDNLYLNLAMSYAGAGNASRAVVFADKLETPSLIGEGRSRVALVLRRVGANGQAGLLLKTAVAVTEPFLTADIKTEYSKFAAASGYKYYCTDYAEVLFQQGEYEEALKYSKIARENFKEVSGKVNTVYAQSLVKLNRYNEAFNILDEAIRKGQSTPAIKLMIKDVYVKAKKGESGYEAYSELIKKEFAEQTRAAIARQMFKQKAPEFSLRDLDGNVVSSADLTGKTIVLDFWATWCGPCKASFPAMQMAVNKYKDDPSVKFLFIHTMEYSKTATEEARRYIESTKYPFQVLMDLKDQKDQKNKVVDSFKTSMIPAKFVIDKHGDLRFRMIGYHEGDDATLEQITAMIELVR